MSQVTAEGKARLQKRWAARDSDPELAARDIRAFAAEFSADSAAIAALIDASAAEVLVFLMFADLEESVRKRLVERGFSRALLARVVELEPEDQSAFLERVLTEKDPVLAARTFTEGEREKALAWMDKLTGQQIMHLSAKTKGYDAFADKRRSALLKFGRLMKSGFSLSVPQVQFLRAMLEDLDELGIITGECYDDACSTCRAIGKVRMGT